MKSRSRPHAIAQHLRSLASGHVSLSISPHFHSVAYILYFSLRLIIVPIITQLTIFPISRFYTIVGASLQRFRFPVFGSPRTNIFPSLLGSFPLPFMIPYGSHCPCLAVDTIDSIIPLSLQLLPSGTKLLNLVYPCTVPHRT